MKFCNLLQSPVPIKSLNLDHVYSAENFKQKCPQIVTDEDAIYLQNNWEKAEDCLYLNIFTVTVNNMIYLNSLFYICIFMIFFKFYLYVFFCVCMYNE